MTVGYTQRGFVWENFFLQFAPFFLLLVLLFFPSLCTNILSVFQKVQSLVDSCVLLFIFQQTHQQPMLFRINSVKCVPASSREFSQCCLIALLIYFQFFIISSLKEVFLFFLQLWEREVSVAYKVCELMGFIHPDNTREPQSLPKLLLYLHAPALLAVILRYYLSGKLQEPRAAYSRFVWVYNVVVVSCNERNNNSYCSWK